MPDPPADLPEPVAGSPYLDLPLVREFDDRSTLWLLEDPEHLRGLLQILDPPLVERLDFTHARRLNRSFVPADLQEKESDLIYAVPFREGSGRAVWVYVLLEHQSEPDPEMGLRLFLYMGELWDSQRREWHDQQRPAAERRLFPVIPVVYYTGEKRWSAPLGLEALMDLPPELERFVPAWETLFLPLRETPPEVLTRFANAVGWALRVLQAENAPRAELERVLREAMAGLEGLSEEQAGQWLRVAWFVFVLVCHRREERALMELVLEEARQSKFHERERMTRMGVSIADQLRAEGKAEGKAEGAAQEARQFLLRQLQARFGELPGPVVAWVEGADREQCEAMGVRLLGAGSLTELGFAGTEDGKTDQAG